ncbi:MAG: DUF1592 domain-containing protein [Planctomycetaceae bacterium]|nr:DUF1592 domain-containing protein [Planctomycetaceae bacterium]
MNETHIIGKWRFGWWSSSKFGMTAVFLGIVLTATTVVATEETAPPAYVTTYFKTYCYQCHGESTQKGDRRFDEIAGKLMLQDDAVLLLKDAVDAINRGDMPPVGKNVSQAPAEQTRRVVQWLTGFLQQRVDLGKPVTTTLRRLNRFEYLNTLRDLLGLHVEAGDPTGDFPADATEHGFDNNGDALTLSDFQLQRYVEVAESALDKAVVFGARRPSSQTWTYSGADFNGVPSYERAPVTWRLIANNETLEIGHGQPSERHANFVPKFVAAGGVPFDGWYVIRLRAEAVNRVDHGYEHKEFERFETFPLKLALWIAPRADLLDKNAAEQRRLVKIWDLSDGRVEVFTKRVWLNKGSIPFVSWANGVSSKGNIRKVAEKYHPEVIRPTKTQLDAAHLGDKSAQALVAKLLRNTNNKLLSEVYHGPRIRLWSLEIEGPGFDQWPPSSHQLLFGKELDPLKVDIERVIIRFAARAFRRPLKTGEVDHYIAFVRKRIEQGESQEASIKLAMVAILTSPRFLYLDEGNDEDPVRTLDPFQIASRLSYFLWSAPPDEELIKLAATEKLLRPGILSAEVDRMLRDEKSDAFVQHFTDTWLQINKLGSMPPDPKAFGSYYGNRLESLFKQETQLFFSDLVQSNGSLLNLLDSEYAFLNDALAEHYGVRGVEGEVFQKVALIPENHRGGLLGQGSILTLSANGIETSPVVRGIWVLENILGTPPPPPPPDVEPLEPDTRGAVSIREQLSQHRTVTACADCNRKIDPAGFALEFYDPIGGYRSHYSARKGPDLLIDGSGELPSGETFQDERDLKRLLLARKDRFAQTLTEKLLTYATGRSMTFRDQTDIKKIAVECGDNGYGLRRLIIDVVLSETFRKP